MEPVRKAFSKPCCLFLGS
ncbi:unnamed protein product [Clonostachys rosea f. rosea IK726]|uniref:Uncharacterized protein n=1 Tax=Clonostachys rosea f. rosea IK726 TaxID=1349383 RepID=A0ACA9U602_BIOOC|nr:unnamed protein product [Clonostachys rosea f. rosea IK726]